jgi:tetratricopeptide (TPR) repeat protein
LQRAAVLPGGRPSLISHPLARRGQFDEAIAAAERGVSLDPRSVNARMAVGTAYRNAGKHDRALEEYRRALEMSPDLARVHFQIGAALVTMGRLAEAVNELEIATQPTAAHNTRFEAYLGYAYAALGRTEDARTILRELESHRREQYVSSFGIALIHDALRENDQALAALERAYVEHAVEFAMLDQPSFTAIASEPRFQAIMRAVGLPR